MHETFFEGLLHLAAMCVLLCAGYLGIDRLAGERATLAIDIEIVRAKVKAMLDEMEIPVGGVELPPQLSCYPVYFLCYVGRVPFRYPHMGIHAAAIVYQIWFAPFLGYFRSKTDRKVVAVLFGLSTFVFLGLALVPVFHDEIAHSLIYLQASSPWFPSSPKFWMVMLWGFFAVVLLWITLTVTMGIAYIKRLDVICKKRQLAAMQKIQAAMAYDVNKARDALNRGLGDLGPGE